MQDILEELKALESVKAELEAKLESARVAERDNLVDALNILIADSGFDADEILTLAAGKHAAKGSGKAKRSNGTAGSAWALKADPSKVYTRGPTPGWMKAAMAGMDRKAFMAEHMVAV